MTRAVAYAAMVMADTVFQSALEQRYGKAAGNMRYARPQDLTEEARRLRAAYQAAVDVWVEEKK